VIMTERRTDIVIMTGVEWEHKIERDRLRPNVWKISLEQWQRTGSEVTDAEVAHFHHSLDVDALKVLDCA
jgi:hypothetical protein